MIKSKFNLAYKKYNYIKENIPYRKIKTEEYEEKNMKEEYF